VVKDIDADGDLVVDVEAGVTCRIFAKHLGHDNGRVEWYPGFTETVHRLVFDFEDHFRATPDLKTILPSGKLQNTKKLQSERGAALTSYAFPQHMSEEQARQYLGTPFVWRRENGTYALVQSWPVEYNSRFKETFVISDDKNPDPTKFHPQAVEDMRKMVVELFGNTANERKIRFCTKATGNHNPVYVGTGGQLLELLRNEKSLLQHFDIVTLTHSGFVCRYVRDNGDIGTQNFDMTPCDRYVLYTRVGSSKMACVKMWAQFALECDLHQKM